MIERLSALLICLKWSVIIDPTHGYWSFMISRLLIIFILSFSISHSETVQLDEKDILTGTAWKVRSTSTKKGTIFMFLSAPCGCTGSQIAHLNKVYSKFNADFDFYGVLANEEEDLEASKKLFKSRNVEFPIIRSVQLAIDLKATHTPSAFVFSPKSDLVYSGGISDSIEPEKETHFYLDEVLTALSKNLKPAYHKQKNMGCSI